ncbi:MAG TPA: hypothetical protein VGK67_07620 [Myxococcales bacterium]|jgi:hypothetical protein
MKRFAKLALVIAVAGLFTGCGRMGSRSAPSIPVPPAPKGSAPEAAILGVGPLVGVDGVLPTLSGTTPELLVARPPGPDSLVLETPLNRKVPLVPAGGASVVDIVIQGVDQGAYEHALLGIAQLQVAVDGCDVPLTLQTGNVDLGIVGRSYPLARIALPAGAQAMSVRLGFDQFGAFESGAVAGTIAAGNVLEFEVPIRVVAQSGVAVVRLDVARSLVSWGGEIVLLPQLQVKY